MTFDLDNIKPDVVEELKIDFLKDSEAKALCSEIRNEDFGVLNDKFQEAVQFVLDNKDPYLCVSWGSDNKVVGLTVGRVDQADGIAYRDWRLVKPENHRQGVGSSMHQYETDKLKGMGVKTVYSEAVTDAGKKFLEKQSYNAAPDGWYYRDL